MVTVMSHEHHPDHEIQFTQEFWNDRYSTASRLWSGNPNPQLVGQTAGLTPGEALDVGCGEGADAIWLARRGWTVTAVDVSALALERAAAEAVAEADGVASRITWQREDLLTWDPGPQRFDLVSAQFMLLPEAELDSMHRRLAGAVRRGGTLLVVGHHHDDLRANVGRSGPPQMFPTATAMAAALVPAEWEIQVAGDISRAATDLDGQPTTVKDAVLRATRRH
jgi:SAM-dependent methyltransferase